MLVASCALWMPRPLVAFPWGSISTSSTRRPMLARQAPTLTAVVVLPTPPFWLTIAKTRPTLLVSCPICSMLGMKPPPVKREEAESAWA